jgi:FHA domain-containing protein
MLSLIVTRCDGNPLATEVRGKFGVLGGTIGAIEGNTLVLDDPKGRVAPLEANIIASPRGYVIRNCAEAPLHVNATPVANSAEAPLAPGDEVTIGPFVLLVAPEGQPAAAPGAQAPGAASAPPGAAPAGAPAAAPAAGPAAEPSPPRTAAPPENLAPPPTAGATPAGGVADAAAQKELLRAFVTGLGIDAVEIPGGLSPELMKSIGEVLRQMTQGTIDLLRIRAEAKSRMHADMTMIGTREINPLKAAWDAEVALQHLLAPQRTDMLDPLRAMKDACDDLRRHDRGLVAGIHGALAGLLTRFDPKELEKRLEGSSRFDSMMPGGVKARRWDMLVELYGDLSVEAERDFWSLFDKEFLKAYQSDSDL